MNGVGGTTVLRTLMGSAGKLKVVRGTGGFRPNAGSAPNSTLFRGSLKGLYTVTYGATGLFTVTFTPTGFKFVAGQLPLILVQSTTADHTNTHRFNAMRRGEWVNSTRSFIIQASQEATAFEVPSNANNWIDFYIEGLV